MSVFIFRRFLTLIATLVGASLIIFLVLDALPGNAAQMLMGADASPDAVRALTIKLGPQWITIASTKLKGVWKEVPQFENDFSAWSWD
ncbi:ABC-type dipeptide/oligopeptide/nickel transport system permease component [Bradyrhizobium sp. AZCC 2176]